MTFILILSSLWALILLALVLGLPRLLVRVKPSLTRNGWLLVFIVAITARLVPVAMLPGGASYDIESYKIVGRLVERGKDVYSSPKADERYPYLPLQMYWSRFSLWTADQSQIPFAKVVKFLPIAADAFIALLIYLVLRRHPSPHLALYSGLFYALNPIPVYVCAYHGQFDAIPALLLLLALLSLGKSSFLSGGWLGLGILVKSWPVLALPSLFVHTSSKKDKIILVSTAIAIPILGVCAYLLIFDASLGTVIRKAMLYNRGVGTWGYTYLVFMLSLIFPGIQALFDWLIQNARLITLILLGIIWWLKARRETALAGVVTILIAFIAVTHSFAIQYLMWIVPFATLDQDFHWLRRYTLGAFIYMFLAYNTLILYPSITNILPLPQADWFLIMSAGLPVWLISVGWAYNRIFKGQVNQDLLASTKNHGQPIVGI